MLGRTAVEAESAEAGRRLSATTGAESDDELERGAPRFSTGGPGSVGSGGGGAPAEEDCEDAEAAPRESDCGALGGPVRLIRGGLSPSAAVLLFALSLLLEFGLSELAARRSLGGPSLFPWSSPDAIGESSTAWDAAARSSAVPTLTCVIL